jgi:hypothetical protein
MNKLTDLDMANNLLCEHDELSEGVKKKVETYINGEYFSTSLTDKKADQVKQDMLKAIEDGSYKSGTFMTGSLKDKIAKMIEDGKEIKIKTFYVKESTESINESELSDDAANAIRDVFFSKQFDKKVPRSIIARVLKSPRWIDMYGEDAIEQAWEELRDEGYVRLIGDNWVWGLEFDEDVDGGKIIEDEDKVDRIFLVYLKGDFKEPFVTEFNNVEVAKREMKKHDMRAKAEIVTAKDPQEAINVWKEKNIVKEEETIKEMSSKRDIFISDDGALKYSVSKSYETDEWVAKAYVNGKYDEGKTIYETDRESAVGSAKYEMTRWNKLHPVVKEEETIKEGEEEYNIPDTNLFVVGFGRDINGNVGIRVKTPNERVRSLSVGDVFQGKTVRDGYWKDSKPEEVAKINAALISYVERFVKGLPLKKYGVKEEETIKEVTEYQIGSDILFRKSSEDNDWLAGKISTILANDVVLKDEKGITHIINKQFVRLAPVAPEKEDESIEESERFINKFLTEAFTSDDNKKVKIKFDPIKGDTYKINGRSAEFVTKTRDNRLCFYMFDVDALENFDADDFVDE